MSNFGNQHWDERFSSKEYIYGVAPNVFFAEQLGKLHTGKIFLPAEGEGRNGVYAALRGWDVDAVDFSSQGKQKALKLAEENNVSLNYEVSDLADYSPKEDHYDAIGIIFMHLEGDLRKTTFEKLVKALKPGGTIIMEVYSKNQLGKDSGGPQKLELLYSLDEIDRIFNDFNPILKEEKEVYLNESILHYGDASIIRFIGTKSGK